jgi:hypothetical protein
MQDASKTELNLKIFPFDFLDIYLILKGGKLYLKEALHL